MGHSLQPPWSQELPFQFLHRIPLAIRIWKGDRTVINFQFLHRIPRTHSFFFSDGFNHITCYQLSIPSPDSTRGAGSRLSSRTSKLSIPSPDSTKPVQGRGHRQEGSFNSFTGFHNVDDYLDDVVMVINPFNSFTGFHFCSQGRAGSRDELSIPSPDSTQRCLPRHPRDQDFQFLHRIPQSILQKWVERAKQLSIPSPDSTRTRARTTSRI